MKIAIIIYLILLVWAIIYEIKHYERRDEKTEELVKSWSED